jgi:hypothetical protein
MSSSITLLGDSIFDNAAYVPGKPCVADQLQELVPTDVDVNLLAVDGDCVRHVKGQLERMPVDATHLFVSVGGNDALGRYMTLFDRHDNAHQMFAVWHQIQFEFRMQYRGMLEAVVALNRQTAVCTIYDKIPNLERIGLEQFALTALSLFNDVIIAEAAAMKLPIVDLRQVCNDPLDYSDVSPIEPSSKGGKKIAKALHLVYSGHDFDTRQSVIYSD